MKSTRSLVDIVHMAELPEPRRQEGVMVHVPQDYAPSSVDVGLGRKIDERRWFCSSARS